MQETWIRSLGQEDPMEKRTAIDNSLRETILLAAMMDAAIEIVAPDDVENFLYREFSLPALSAGYGGGQSLRAPPAMV